MQFMDNKKIRTKLIIVAIIFMAIIILISAISFVNMNNINNGMTTLYKDHTLTIEYVGAADASLYKLRGDLFKYIIVPDERAKLEADINADIASINQAMQDVRNSPLSAEQKASLDSFDKAWASYQSGIVQTIADVKSNNSAEAANSIKDGSILSISRSGVDSALSTLILQTSAEADQINRQGDTTFANAVIIIVIVTIISAFISVALIMLLTSSVAKPLERLAEVTKKISAGNLNIEIPHEERRDEVGVLMESMREMSNNLRTLNKEIQEGVNVLSTSVSELMATMAQTASGAQETASSISETTTTVEEVKQTADITSQKAKNMAEGAAEASTLVEAGRESVEDTVAGMNRIQQQMDTIGESIARLNEQSQAISEIIGVVNDVAEQVNILSVNAAIEAAKAGDQGKGFAVVAQEIRVLADESKRATTQIQKLLKDTQKAVSTAVMAVEQGSRVVEAGVKQSAETGNAIKSLEDVNQRSAQSASQIALSSKEQSTGMEQVAIAMENIKKASAQNVQATKEAEKVARNLQELGLKLKQMMNRYQT